MELWTPEFSEAFIGKAGLAFYWGDGESPFVVSVQCQATEMGHFADWWVSGVKWENEAPSLILRVKQGINCPKTELEANLWQLWLDHVRELAFSSSMGGGILSPESEVAELSEQNREDLLYFHLRGNERKGNFSKISDTKIMKTANMYQLLKSFGSKQPQKVIAEFESFFTGEDVKPTAINQRLTQAKYKKLRDSQ